MQRCLCVCCVLHTKCLVTPSGSRYSYGSHLQMGKSRLWSPRGFAQNPTTGVAFKLSSQEPESVCLPITLHCLLGSDQTQEFSAGWGGGGVNVGGGCTYLCMITCTRVFTMSVMAWVSAHVTRAYVNMCSGGFPGGPVVKTPCFQGKRPGFDPWPGN